MQIVGETVKNQVKDAPEVKDEFGEIKSITANFTATGQANSKGTIVFDVEGTKENGQLIIGFPPDTQPGQVSRIESAKIRKYDGREIEIPIENLLQAPKKQEQTNAPESDQKPTPEVDATPEESNSATAGSNEPASKE